MKESFVKNGTLATTKAKWTTRKEEDNPAMAYVHNLGSVSNSGKEGFMMLGYDDIYSIEYMYEKRMGYWKHDGKVTIFDAFEKLKTTIRLLWNVVAPLTNLFMTMQKRQAAKNMQKLFGILSPSDLCS